MGKVGDYPHGFPRQMKKHCPFFGRNAQNSVDFRRFSEKASKFHKAAQKNALSSFIMPFDVL
ncbi:MAG: hypothetical protein E7458_01830 [Ruminococcaceae bacterium]|nr:hypothetical protein [Oscillospiraceae bacterium]